MDHSDAHGVSRVRLLDAEPELGRILSAEEREEVQRVTVSVRTVAAGAVDPEHLLHEGEAFGAFILDGTLLHRVTLWAHPTLRLLGRGDVLSPRSETPSALGGRSTYRAIGELRLVMLDARMLFIAHRVPRLFAALHQRIADVHERLATQLVICQLPRVEERILGMMWLLADAWGRVTSSGTVVPIALTHDALGELIGARRPTVSLALKELSEDGALIRQHDGWLLLKTLPANGEIAAPLREDAVGIVPPASTWLARPGPVPPESAILRDIVAALRASHAQTRDDVQTRLRGSLTLRTENLRLRRQIADRRSGRPRRVP